jgi:hypothetical protein
MTRGLIPAGGLAFVLLFCACNSPAPGGPDPVPAVRSDSIPRPLPAADSPLPERSPGGVPPDTSLHILEGRFVEIQMGDYAHFIIRDVRGETHSFYLADDLPAALITPFEGGRMGGKNVRLTWHWIYKDLPEAGGREWVREMTAVEGE